MFSPTEELPKDKQSHSHLTEKLPYRFRRTADTTPGNWVGYERGVSPRKVGRVVPGFDDGYSSAFGLDKRIADQLPISSNCVSGRVASARNLARLVC
jgi:hypothetical protein